MAKDMNQSVVSTTSEAELEDGGKTYKELLKVTKKLKKNGKGIVIFTGDVQPIEVMCHLPIMCEDRNIQYCYVPSRLKLGGAIGSSKPTCTIFIDESADKKSYDH